MWVVPLLAAAGIGVLFEKTASARAPVFALVPQGSDADPPLPLNSYGTILAKILASGEMRTLPVQVVSEGAPLTLLLLDPSPLAPVAGLAPGTFIEATRAYVKSSSQPAHSTVAFSIDDPSSNEYVAAVNFALQYEKDPAKLRVFADNATNEMAATLLRNRAMQIEQLGPGIVPDMPPQPGGQGGLLPYF